MSSLWRDRLRPVGIDDAEVVGDAERMAEGTFVAGRRVAVEVEDWRGGSDGIAVFVPGCGRLGGRVLALGWHGV